MEAAYPQTGMTGAGHFVDPNSLSARQANFNDIVSVDPVAENELVEGEPVVLASTSPTPEKLAKDEDLIEPIDNNKKADSSANDDQVFVTWDD